MLFPKIRMSALNTCIGHFMGSSRQCNKARKKKRHPRSERKKQNCLNHR